MLFLLLTYLSSILWKVLLLEGSGGRGALLSLSRAEDVVYKSA